MTTVAANLQSEGNRGDIKTQSEDRFADLLTLVLAGAIFSALSLWYAIKSAGFLEADSCTHYLYARFAIGELHYLVNVWGRPLVTALYAIPAGLFGRIGVRVTSLFVALAIALIAYRLARLYGFRWPALAFIFTLAQPLVFLHSFSELTELPFALLLALAFWMYRVRRLALMAVLVAILPLARPEGFGFLLLAAVALVLHRKWGWLAILPVPILLWTWAGWTIYGKPVYSDALANHLPPSWHWLLWLRHEWPYAQRSAYQPGSLLHFVELLPAVVGPLIFPAVVLGVWRSLRRTQERLIAAIPLLILLAHSVIYALGLMASNGELRYMLIVAPFWALLATRGWEWVFERFEWRVAGLAAGVAALVPFSVNFYYPVLPLKQSADWEQVEQIATWYKSSDYSMRYPRLLVSHPAFYYYLDVSPTDRGHVLEWRKETVTKNPPGTLLVWDPSYAQFNSDRNRIVSLEEIEQAGWMEDASAEDFAPGNFRIFHSRRSIR
jgi:hypothetical protein